MLLGGLHICFKFLKAIGQHLENAGLDDIWVDAGLFTPKSTDAMMEGKAYYRAVRGHTLAYEALSHIRGKELKLTGQQIEITIEVEKVANIFN